MRESIMRFTIPLLLTEYFGVYPDRQYTLKGHCDELRSSGLS